MAAHALGTLEWIFCLLIVKRIIVVGLPNAKFELTSVEQRSDNEKKIKIDMRVNRIGRAGHVLSGTIDINYDMNKNTTMEATLHHSDNGKDYNELPGKMHRRDFAEFVAEYYEDYWYANFKNCSDSPEPKDMLPLAQKLYTFVSCPLKDLKGFPIAMVDGFYKVELSVRGEVDWELIVIGRYDFKYM